PCSELVNISDHSGWGNTQPLLMGYVHKGSSGIHDRETFRCPERALDQGTHRRFGLAVTFLPGMETMQMLGGKVIA
ncbi:MAG: hypothetical protein WBG40_18690, partial [Candidatus Sulfotelmatobacter sp.]